MAKSYNSIKAGWKNPNIDSKTGAIKKKRYDEIKASDYDFGVDEDYIKSFLESSKSYLENVSKDSENVNYNNAKSYSYKQLSWATLCDKADTIRAYLNANKRKLNQQAYSDMISYLDSFDDNSSKALNFYSKNADFFSQFETEDDYNRYKIGWLQDKAETNSETVKARKDYYNSNKTKIADIDEQIKAKQKEISSIGATWFWETDKRNAISDKNKEIRELIAKKKSIEADNRNYKRTQSNVDSYYDITEQENFEQDSQYRDYNNPTRQELWDYDRLSDDWYSSGEHTPAYYDDEGNARDVKGNIIQTEMPSAPVIEDKLGMYLSATPEDVAKAYKMLSASQGNTTQTWATLMQEGETHRWEFLEDNEIGIYYTLLKNNGQEAAYKFLDDMASELGRREEVNTTEAVEGASAPEKIALNIASIPMTALGSITAFVDDAYNLITEGEIDPYSAAHRFQTTSNIIRSDTAKDINEFTGNMKIPGIGFSFGDAYQAIMSGVDSIVGGKIFGKGYSAVMGMGSASMEARDLYEQGATAGQIAAGGLLAGTAEMLFEKYSLEHFLKIKDTKTLGQALKQMLAHGGVETSEEIATELANTITNAIVMGSQSDWQGYRDKYLKEGYTEAQATVRALFKDVAPNVINAGIGGFISGSALGGIQSGINKLYYNNQTKNVGRGIVKNGNLSNLTEQAYSLDDSKANLKLKALADKVAGVDSDTINRFSAYKVGKLHEGVQNAQVDNLSNSKRQAFTEAVKAELEAKGVENVDKAAKVLVKAQFDDGLSNSEGKIYESVDGNEILTKVNNSKDVEVAADGSQLFGEQQKFYNDSMVIAESQAKAQAQQSLDELVAKYGKNITVQGTFNDSVINYSKTSVEGKVNWDNLTSAQQEAINFMKSFSKVTGVNIELFKSNVKNGKHIDENGRYDPDTNTIYIDIYAGRIDADALTDAIIPTLSHELTHWMKDKAPELYRKIDELVFKSLTESGKLTEAEILIDKRLQLAEHHPNEKISNETVRDEVIARACEDMLSMSEEGKKLFNSLSEPEKKTFVDKIKDVITNIKNWVSDLLSQYKSNSPEAREMRKYQDRLNELSKMWDEMLRQSIQANQSLQKEGITGEELAKSTDTTVKHSQRDVEKGKKRYYNEFNSLAMQWANSAGTEQGDIKRLFDGKNRKWALAIADENSDGGYRILKKGNYEVVRNYEQTYRGNNRSIHRITEALESAYGRDGSNNILFGGGQQYDDGGILQTERRQLQSNSKRSNDNLLSSDRETSGDIKRSDREYLDAVERGDIETAQKTGDEVAKKWANGNEISYNIVYEGYTPVTDNTAGEITGEELAKKASTKTTKNDDVRFSEREIIGESGKSYGMGVYLDSNILTDSTATERKEKLKEFVVSELLGERLNAYDNAKLSFEALKNGVENVKFSDRDYAYDELISKPDMNITILESAYPNSRADIIHQAKKNAASVGKINNDGSVSVYVDDLSNDVIVGTNALKHSLDRRLSINAPVMLKIGEILKNSVKVNELIPRSDNIKNTYALIGAAKNINSEIYVVSFVVNSFTNEIDSVDVLYSANAKTEPAGSLSPRVSTPATDSEISISDLLDYVNNYFPDILPEDVLKHYGHTKRPEGKIGESALFSDRGTYSVYDIIGKNEIANKETENIKTDFGRPQIENLRNIVQSKDFNWDNWNLFIQEKNKTVWEATLNIATTKNGEKILYDIDPIKKVEQAVKSATSTTNGIIRNSKPNVKYSISGINSKTADTSTLAIAETMLEQGTDSEIIRQETGWFKGYDGKWRYEIDDSNIEINTKGFFTNPDVIRYNELKEKFNDGTINEAEWDEMRSLTAKLKGVKMTPDKLSDIVKHSKLFEAYPELKNTKIEFSNLGDTLGEYYKKQNKIVLNENLKTNETQLKNTIVHEIQHAVQDIEGFAKGASSKYWHEKTLEKYRNEYSETRTEFKKLYDNASSELKDALNLVDDTINHFSATEESIARAYDNAASLIENENDLDTLWEFAEAGQKLNEFYKQDDVSARSLYQRTAGEIEARDVTHRVDYTAEQRKNTRPDIDRTDVVFAEGGETSAEIVTLDNGKQYVRASEKQVIEGEDATKWSQQVADFINKELRNWNDFKIVTAEGDVLTLTRDTAYKAGTRNDIKNPDGTYRAMTDAEYKTKLNAEIHINELAEVSKKNNGLPVPDKKNHRFAKDGFTYRTAYFEDYNGEYYKITISVGNNGNVATVYNVGKIKKDALPNGNIKTILRGSKPNSSSFEESIAPSAKKIAVVGSKPLDATLSKDSISPLPENVNYSISGDSEGTQLSKGQQEYFKNSKVVDDNGNLTLTEPDIDLIEISEETKFLSGMNGKDLSKAQMHILDLAKALDSDLSIEFADGLESDGMYIRSQNKILIKSDISVVRMYGIVFKHEMMHHFETKKLYDKFFNYCFNNSVVFEKYIHTELKKENPNIEIENETRESVFNFYTEYKYNQYKNCDAISEIDRERFTYENAQQVIVADFFANVLFKGKENGDGVLKALANNDYDELMSIADSESALLELKQKEPKLLEKIAQWFKDMINKLRGWAAGDTVVSDLVRELDYLENLMKDVYWSKDSKESLMPKENDIKNSIKKISSMQYSEQLYQIEKKTMNGSNSLYIGMPSKHLQSVGFSNYPFVMNQSDYRKSRRKEANNKHYSSHAVPFEFFEKMPQYMADAPMLVDNGEKVSVITEHLMNDTKGEKSYVIVGVLANQTMEKDNVNLVKSVYPLDDFVSIITVAAENGKLIIANKNKAEQMLATIGIQPAEVSRIVNLAKMSLAQKYSDVKYSINDDVRFLKRDNNEMTDENYYRLLSKKPINVSKGIKAKIGQQRINRYANMSDEQVPNIDFFRVADYNKINVAYKYTVRNDGKNYFTVIKKQQIKPDSIPKNLNIIIQEELESERVNKRVNKSRNGRNNNLFDNNVFRNGTKLQNNDTLVERGEQSNQKRYNAQSISNIGRGVNNLDREYFTAAENVKRSDRYWYPDMSKSELAYVRERAAYELENSDNYIDSENKWLYDKKSGNPFFALYSTADEADPTVLYACKGTRAEFEYRLFSEYILQEKNTNGNIYSSTKTVDRLLDFLEDFKGKRTVYSGNTVGRSSNNGNVGIYSRNSRNRPSEALLNCLRNIREIQERNGRIKLFDQDSKGQQEYFNKNSVFAESRAKTQAQQSLDKLNAKYGKALTIQGEFDDSVIDYESTGAEDKVEWKSLAPTQKQAITFLKGFSKATGVNIKLVQSEIVEGVRKGANGSYNPNTNTIEIDVYAGRIDADALTDAIIPTLSHELTHWMKDKAPELYRKIDELVFKSLTESGKLTEAEILIDKRLQLAEHHPNEKISNETVRDEVIARACEDMLSMSEEGKKLFNSLSEPEKKTFVDKIKDVITNIKNWVSDLLSQYKSNSPEAREMRKYQDRLNELSKMWDEMLSQSIQANQSLQKEGITGEELAKSVTNSKSEISDTQFSDRYWYPNMSKSELAYVRKRAAYEVNTSDNYIDNGNKWLYNEKNGKTFFALYSTANETDPTILYACKGTRAEYEHQFLSEQLEKEVDGNESNDSKSRTIDRILGSCENAISGENANNRNVVGRRGNNGDVKVYSRNSRNRLSEALLNCLRNIREIQERNGRIKLFDQDSKGNTLSKGQIDFFKDSKVRNENEISNNILYEGYTPVTDNTTEKITGEELTKSVTNKESKTDSIKNASGENLAEKYTEMQYNNFGWVAVNNILTGKELKKLYSQFANIKLNKNYNYKNNVGEYVIAVGDKYGAIDKIVYIKGTNKHPIIRQVVEFIDTIPNEIREDIIKDVLQDEYRKLYTDAFEVAEAYAQKEYFIRYVASDLPSYSEIRNNARRQDGKRISIDDRKRSNGDRNQRNSESKAQNSNDGIKYFDREYLNAVESGDMEEPQKLDDFVSRITAAAENGKLIIANKNKAEQMLATIGIQPAEVSRIVNLAKTSLAQQYSDVKYLSSIDSEGSQLTKDQQEYFKDSKIVDDNGNLKVMYYTTEDEGLKDRSGISGDSQRNNDVAKEQRATLINGKDGDRAYSKFTRTSGASRGTTVESGIAESAKGKSRTSEYKLTTEYEGLKDRSGISGDSQRNNDVAKGQRATLIDGKEGNRAFSAYSRTHGTDGRTGVRQNDSERKGGKSKRSEITPVKKTSSEGGAFFYGKNSNQSLSEETDTALRNTNDFATAKTDVEKSADYITNNYESRTYDNYVDYENKRLYNEQSENINSNGIDERQIERYAGIRMKKSADDSSNNLSRANIKGENVNEFYSALDKRQWHNFYRQIADKGYLQNTQVGDLISLVVNDKLLIAQRQIIGKDAHDFQVVDVYKISDYADSYILNEIKDVLNESGVLYDNETATRTIFRVYQSFATESSITRFNRNNLSFDNGVTERQKTNYGGRINEIYQDKSDRVRISDEYEQDIQGTKDRLNQEHLTTSKGVDIGQELQIDCRENTTSEIDENSRRIIEKICDRLGRTVVFEDLRNIKDERGNIISPEGFIKNGIIHINLYAKNPIGFIFKHELTHFSENSSGYNDYVKTVKKSTIYKSWLQEKTNESNIKIAEYEYKKQILASQNDFYSINDPKINNELIADFTGEMLFTENGSKMTVLLEEVDTKHQNKFVRFILDFISYIKKKIGGQDFITYQLSVLEDSFKRMVYETSDSANNGLYTNGDTSYCFIRCNDVETIRKAEEMEADGKLASKIFRELGVIRNAYGIWLEEVDTIYLKLFLQGNASIVGNKPNDKIKVNNGAIEGKLRDFIKYKKLFEIYPRLANTKVIIRSSTSALDTVRFIPGMNTIFINKNIYDECLKSKDTRELKAYMLGAIQNVIQHIEGRSADISLEAWKRKEARGEIPYSKQLGRPFTAEEAYKNTYDNYESEMVSNLRRTGDFLFEFKHSMKKVRDAHIYSPKVNYEDIIVFDDDGNAITADDYAALKGEKYALSRFKLYNNSEMQDTQIESDEGISKEANSNDEDASSFYDESFYKEESDKEIQTVGTDNFHNLKDFLMGEYQLHRKVNCVNEILNLRAGSDGIISEVSHSPEEFTGIFNKRYIKKMSEIPLYRYDTVGRLLSDEVRSKFADTFLKNSKGQIVSLYVSGFKGMDDFKNSQIGLLAGTLKSAIGEYEVFKENATRNRTPVIKEVYVNMKNPFVVPFTPHERSFFGLNFELIDRDIFDFSKYMSLMHIKNAKLPPTYNGYLTKITRESLKAKGYDGIIYCNGDTDPGSATVLIFDPEQIVTVARNGVLQEESGVIEDYLDEEEFNETVKSLNNSKRIKDYASDYLYNNKVIRNEADERIKAGNSGFMENSGANTELVVKKLKSELNSKSKIELSDIDTAGRKISKDIKADFASTAFKNENGEILSFYKHKSSKLDISNSVKKGVSFCSFDTVVSEWINEKKQKQNKKYGFLQEFYINSENPFVMKGNVWSSKEITDYLLKKGKITEKYYYSVFNEGKVKKTNFDAFTSKKIIAKLQMLGYDSVVLVNDSGKCFVTVFDENQIKPVAHNGINIEDIYVDNRNLKNGYEIGSVLINPEWKIEVKTQKLRERLSKETDNTEKLKALTEFLMCQKQPERIENYEQRNAGHSGVLESGEVNAWYAKSRLNAVMKDGRSNVPIADTDTAGRRLSDYQKQMLAESYLKDSDGKPLSVFIFNKYKRHRIEHEQVGLTVKTLTAAHDNSLAERRIHSSIQKSNFEEYYPIVKNSYFIMFDPKNATPKAFGEYMFKEGIITNAEYRALLSKSKLDRSAYNAVSSAYLIRTLKSKGFDSIAYMNEYEDPGSISVIVFDENQLIPVAVDGLPVKNSNQTLADSISEPAFSLPEDNANTEQSNENIVEGSQEKEIDTENDVVYNEKVEITLDSLSSEIVKTKPKYSPSPQKWLNNGGRIEIDTDGFWIYTNSDGISVKYVNGYPDFAGAGLVKNFVDIGEFKGRVQDARKANKISPRSKDSVWHHSEDGHTMQEISKDIHAQFTHCGGMLLLNGGKKRNGFT